MARKAYSNANFQDLNDILSQGYQQSAQGMSNINFGITQADRDLVQQGVGGATDIAMRQMEKELPRILAKLSGQAGVRGIGGSGIEGIQRGLVGEQSVQSLADLLSQQQQLGSQYLMQVPMQRAQFQLSRNQALFQNLIQSVSPQYQQRMWSAEMQQQDKDKWLKLVGALGGAAGKLPWTNIVGSAMGKGYWPSGGPSNNPYGPGPDYMEGGYSYGSYGS